MDCSQAQALQELMGHMSKAVSDSKMLRDNIEFMIEVYGNIKRNPDNEKYKKLRLSNKKVHAFWSQPYIREFFESSGWSRCDEGFIYYDAEDISVPLNVLLENRFVKPATEEWVPETKQIVQNPEKAREDKLRAEAAIQREKEIREYRKQKKYEEEIAQAIRAEHKNDRERRVASKAAKACPLPSELKQKRVSQVSQADGTIPQQ